MAHFAQLDENNMVTWVTYLDNSIIIDENGEEQESLGIQHIHNTIPGSENYTWKQTSYNGNFRRRYAAIGSLYHEETDTFTEEKPYDSWILDSDNIHWKPPTPKPDIIINDNEAIIPFWNEETDSWDTYVSTKPFDSWTFNQTNGVWAPPIPFPTDSPYYHWDEEGQTWYYEEPT